MMNRVLAWLIGRWYKPAEQDEREARTVAAHERAIELRVKSEQVDVKVEHLRRSAARAGRRLTK